MGKCMPCMLQRMVLVENDTNFVLSLQRLSCCLKTQRFLQAL
jgi:hypothetical protein